MPSSHPRSRCSDPGRCAPPGACRPTLHQPPRRPLLSAKQSATTAAHAQVLEADAQQLGDRLGRQPLAGVRRVEHQPLGLAAAGPVSPPRPGTRVPIEHQVADDHRPARPPRWWPASRGRGRSRRTERDPGDQSLRRVDAGSVTSGIARGRNARPIVGAGRRTSPGSAGRMVVCSAASAASPSASATCSSGQVTALGSGAEGVQPSCPPGPARRRSAPRGPVRADLSVLLGVPRADVAAPQRPALAGRDQLGQSTR